MRTRFMGIVVALAIATLAMAGCQAATPAPAPTAAPPKAAAPAPTAAPAAPTAAAAAKPAATAAPAAKPAPTAAPAASAAPKVPVPPTVNGQKWPSKAVNIDNAGNPGGGLDLFGRSVGDALTKEGIFPGTFVFDSHGGGGGNNGMAFLVEQKANPNLLMCNTNRTFLNPMMGTTKLTLKDYVPLAKVATDYMVLTVRKDSPYKTLKDLMDALKKDPKAASFGNGSAPPSDDYLNVLYTALAAGVDPTKLNIVVFEAGGGVNSAILGGNLDVGSTTAGESLSFYQSGDMRFLGVSSPERLPLLKDVPTFKEQGYNVVVSHWRGLFLPPNTPKELQDYWASALGVMIDTPTWKSTLEKNSWASDFLAGDKFLAYLNDEAKAADTALRPLGLLPPTK